MCIYLCTCSSVSVCVCVCAHTCVYSFCVHLVTLKNFPNSLNYADEKKNLIFEIILMETSWRLENMSDMCLIPYGSV